MPTPSHQIATTLRSSRDALIVCHVAPDGDCLGASLALQLALTRLGIPAVIGSSDGVPQSFRFLPGADAIATTPPAVRFDAGIAVECSSPDRAGAFTAALMASRTVINIDHHLSNAGYGQLVYWDTTAAAVGEQIARVIDALGVRLDAEIAQSLLTAIVTDTGCFRFPNTTAYTLRLAATLIDAGAKIQTIVERIFESRTLAGLRLMGAALSNAQVSADRQVIWTVITPAILAATGATAQESTGVVGQLRQVEGTRVALLFEVTPDGVRVGIRSRDGVRANVIAEAFGGGGHVGAAGFNASGPLDDVVVKTLAEVQKELRNPQPSPSKAVPTS